MTLFMKGTRPRFYGSPTSFVAPQAFPVAALAPCFVMCVDLSCPHWVESSLKIRAVRLVLPLCPQQQVQGHVGGTRKSWQLREGMSISSDRRLTPVEDTATGPLHMPFPLFSVCFPNCLHNHLSGFTPLRATCPVEPSLTILAKTAPFPRLCLPVPLCFFFSWHVSPLSGVVCVHAFPLSHWTVSSTEAASVSVLLTAAFAVPRMLQVCDDIC